MKFRLLLQGFDTAECAYFLIPSRKCALDYKRLAVEKETLRQNKSRDPKVIELGGIEFLFHPYGSSSGYPFIISNQDYKISFGEFNHPAFFVKFKSLALWQQGVFSLHNQFIQWAERLGFEQQRPESLSRVDFTFDYGVDEIDFDEDHFVSRSKKDTRYRKDHTLQTLQFGKDEIVLRVYDKIAEIEEKSHKEWFYDLWNTEPEQKVWRIEWQVRKAILKRFGIHNLQDLQDGVGDILRYLSCEHETLREPNSDSNRSRWPLHPLWEDLQKQIESFCAQGLYRSIDTDSLLDERLLRIAISIHGYLKMVAAIECIQRRRSMISDEDALKRLYRKMKLIHDPLTWKVDVEKRIEKIRLGQW